MGARTAFKCTACRPRRAKNILVTGLGVARPRQGYERNIGWMPVATVSRNARCGLRQTTKERSYKCYWSRCFS